jgi:MFS transporter, ACS family, tartrate transporter
MAELIARPVTSIEVRPRAVRNFVPKSDVIRWKVMRLSLVYFGLTTGLYGIELWMPQMLQGFGLSDLYVGFVGAIPYLVAICTMGFWAKHSDKTGERYWHVAFACAVGGGGLLAGRTLS